MLLTRGVIRLVGLTQTVIVARLLSPEAFGIFGLTLLLLSMLEHFTEAGLTEALIQRPGDVGNHLDVAWTVGILRGGIITLVLTGIAPWAAGWFGEPLLRTFLPLAGLIVLLGSLRNVGIVHFRKELNFSREFLYRIGGPIVAFPLVVATAYYTRSVWALMVMLFVDKATETILSYVLHRYRPSFRLVRERFDDLFAFGRWILGSKILKFGLLEGDDLFVGKFFGPVELGLYQLAYRFSQMPVKEFCTSVNKVLFPAFSKLQDDVERLRETWFDSLRIVSSLAFPMSLGIACVAPEAVRIVLGEDWLGMVVPVRVLALLGLIRSINYDAVFKATDNPGWITKLALVRFLFLAATILPLSIHLGLPGTALSVLAAALVIEPYALNRTLTILGARYRSFFSALAIPATASGVMLLVLTPIRTTYRILTPWGLAGEILLGALVYAGSLFLLSWLLRTRLYSLLGRLLTLLNESETR